MVRPLRRPVATLLAVLFLAPGVVVRTAYSAVAEASPAAGAAAAEAMLAERPAVAGIGVAGMPKGSPGMPGMPEPYTVEAFTVDGSTAPYARH